MIPGTIGYRYHESRCLNGSVHFDQAAHRHQSMVGQFQPERQDHGSGRSRCVEVHCGGPGLGAGAATCRTQVDHHRRGRVQCGHGVHGRRSGFEAPRAHALVQPACLGHAPRQRRVARSIGRELSIEMARLDVHVDPGLDQPSQEKLRRQPMIHVRWCRTGTGPDVGDVNRSVWERRAQVPRRRNRRRNAGDRSRPRRGCATGPRPRCSSRSRGAWRA